MYAARSTTLPTPLSLTPNLLQLYFLYYAEHSKVVHFLIIVEFVFYVSSIKLVTKSHVIFLDRCINETALVLQADQDDGSISLRAT